MRDAPSAATLRASTHIPAAAIALIVGAVMCFSILDGIVKSLAPRYPVSLLVWARYGVQALAMLIWLGPAMGTALLRTSHMSMQLSRAVILVLSSIFFVNALRSLPLADATAINYSTPTVVAILAVLLLKEKMTRPRAAFVIAGILGMALIVRPGHEIFRGASLFAIAAAACYASFQILTRKLAHEDSRVLLFYPAFAGAALMPLLVPWHSLSSAIPWQDVALIITGGLFGTVGHFMFILAFQRAPASGLTPFTYMQLVWATLVGWIAFGDFPDEMTLIGMSIIAGSGLLLAWHERRQSSVQVPEPAAVD
ncbi:MAG: DMT family transporter [Pseudomonadota bacterium]|nr:DMT family transporter [Pseudomonadota bacterium]